MNKLKLAILLCIIFSVTASFAGTRNSYTKYAKHMMPTYYDPYFITDLENCRKNEYMDWTGTYKYFVIGKKEDGTCELKMQYNPWPRENKNEWYDYKVCYLNDVRLKELSNAMWEHSNKISSYALGAYKTTGTKVEYLLYNYEYYGACKLLWDRRKIIHTVKQ